MSESQAPSASDQSRALTLGWLPPLTLTASVGVLTVAAAFAASRHGESLAMGLWWTGLVVVYAPVLLRQLQPGVTRLERLALAVLLGVALLLVKVLYMPFQLQFSDEFYFWRSAMDILQHHHLFVHNVSLQVKPVYPALQEATAAVASLSGLSVTHAGLVVIDVLRPVYVVALYLFYEQVSGSTRLAGIASTLYMANPNFLVFDSLYVYEAFALPFAVLALYLAARWLTSEGATGRLPGVFFWVVALTVVVAHHVTSYFLVAYLAVWTIVAFQQRRSGHQARPPLRTTLTLLVLILAWILFIAPGTLSYFNGPFNFVATRLAGEATGKLKVVHGFVRPQGPLAQTILDLGANAAIVLILLGTFGFVWTRMARWVGMRVALVASLGYLGVLALRLVPDGAELAGRSMPFIYLPLSLALAAGLLANRARVGRTVVRTLLPFGAGMLIIVGGLASGFPASWARLPGPYLPASWERSDNLQSAQAAAWVGSHFPGDQYLLTDQGNMPYMAAYGGELPTDTASWIMFVPTLTTELQRALAIHRIKLIVVDMRMSDGLSQRGFYYYSTEPQAYVRRQPLNRELLTKFEKADFLDRVYDSGDIIIYTVRGRNP